MVKTYQHLSLEKADLTLNSILNLVAEGIWDWNANTGHVVRSPGWYRMLGYDVGAFKEDVFTWESVIHPDDYQKVMSHFEAYILGKSKKYEIEYRCKKADDSYLWIVDRGNIINYNDDGSVARMIGAHQNIHHQKMAQLYFIEQNQLLKEGNVTLEKIISRKAQELQQKNVLLEKKISEIELISNTDTLTKVANRKMFEKALSKEVSRANRYNHALSLVIFDLDYFKEINDNFGHKIGDELLCKLSKLIINNIRDIDLLARWGGDEFVMILPEISQQEAHQTCEKLRLLISEQQLIKGIDISCSFGVSQYLFGETLDELFQRVDKLLFFSKEHGRNMVKSSSPE